MLNTNMYSVNLIKKEIKSVQERFNITDRIIQTMLKEYAIISYVTKLV